MTAALKEFLHEVTRVVRPAKEPTLFSLGGRGHYENPVSDLLAFFLRPEGEHGLRTLFLKAFFDCCGRQLPSSRCAVLLPLTTDLNLQGVSIRREVPTDERTRIDLLVEGPGWVLVIENKIYSPANNPFTSYETYIERSVARRREIVYALLTPDGACPAAAAKWLGVSYQDYCQALRQQFGKAVIDQPFSKWQIFAREFILHLETELYDSLMTPEDAAFVEQHAKQIEDARNLADQYVTFLCAELENKLEADTGDKVTARDEGWAIRCKSEAWSAHSLAFQTPLKTPELKFNVSIYLYRPTDDQFAKAATELTTATPWDEENGAWRAWRTPGIASREDAIKELCRFARILKKILPPPASSPPTVPPSTPHLA